MHISLIAAVASNGIIGGNGKLLWRLPRDMKRFKTITTGHHVVMGRKTWESLGRPLPNRTNLVVTRNPDYEAEGAQIVGSIDAALDVARAAYETDLFIIGGEEIYRQSLRGADRIHLTQVHAKYEGDARFPDFDMTGWIERDREEVAAGDGHDVAHTYLRLVRKR